MYRFSGAYLEMDTGIACDIRVIYDRVEDLAVISESTENVHPHMINKKQYIFTDRRYWNNYCDIRRRLTEDSCEE